LDFHEVALFSVLLEALGVEFLRLPFLFGAYSVGFIPYSHERTFSAEVSSKRIARFLILPFAFLELALRFFSGLRRLSIGIISV
jgi:hypothetical protein